MFTTILMALSGQLGTIFSFITTNPLARKIGLVAIVLAALWYANKLTMNHAYEQGKNEGARVAWVQAQEVQQKVWDAAQSDIKKQYAAVQAQAKQVQQAQQDFAEKHAVLVAKRTETETKVATEIAKVEQEYTKAPLQQDGLPDKQVIMDALTIYKDAYDSTVAELKYTEQEYDESVKLQNQSIAERNAQIDVLKQDLELTQKQVQFYKDGFEQVSHNKSGSFWHRVKRVVTLGIAR
jgi:Fe-S cluster assembly scaffold protein SufB